jgi:hypothetical protein
MRTKHYKAKQKTKGKVVELKDGRQGIVYYSEQKDIPAGKVAVHVWTEKIQLGIFAEFEIANMETKKILCDPAGLKIIGFID